MRKPRLFIWGDTPNVTTGFGNVAKNLFRDLHLHFDVYILGINEYGLKKYDTTNWFIYSVDQRDPYGYGKLGMVLDDCKPDLILLFQDIFNVQIFMQNMQREGKLIQLPPTVIYFPIDGAPVNPTWRGLFEDPRVTKIITYSEWAKEQLIERFPFINRDSVDVLYHGIDVDTFKPAPKGEVKEFRLKSGWDYKHPVHNTVEKRFILSMVNRYQPRKMVALGIKAAALVTKGYKVCKCGNLYSLTKARCDLNMCGPEDIVEMKAPNPDVGLYLHMNVAEPIMGPAPSHLLPVLVMNCGYEDYDVGKNLFLLGNRNHLAHPMTEAEMALIYSAADINLSTAIGEGFGLSLAESAACGTQSIAPKNSAIPEVLRETGYMVENASLINMAMDNSHIRPVVSLPALVKTIEKAYKDWQVNGRNKVFSQECIDNVKNNFLWEDKREYITNTLLSLVPTTLNE